MVEYRRHPLDLFQRGKQKCSPNASLCPVVSVCFPGLRVCVIGCSSWCHGSACVWGESTPIAHLLNDWAMLMHLSSPFWSRQHSIRGSSARLQEEGCSVRVRSLGYTAADCLLSWCTSGGNRPLRGRAAAGRRCRRYLLMAWLG